MPPPTLHYAPVPLTPIRFGFIALASSLILASIAITVLPRLLVAFLPTATYVEIHNLLLQIICILHSIAILAAVFLFNAALPSLHVAPKHRLPFLAAAALAAAALAAAYLLIRLFILVLFLAFTATPPVTAIPSQSFLILVSCLSVILQLALLAAAAVFFYFTARRLHRTPLGIIAAAAFAPSFLLTTLSLLFNFYHLFTPSLPFYILTLYSYASSANLLLQFLLWLTLALFTTLLALKPPRPPASTPL